DYPRLCRRRRAAFKARVPAVAGGRRRVRAAPAQRPRGDLGLPYLRPHPGRRSRVFPADGIQPPALLMPTVRKILIADPELDVVRSLSKALRQRGYQVSYAADGSKALEMSVLRHPEVVLFDDDCTLIDAKSFINILQSNP